MICARLAGVHVVVHGAGQAGHWKERAPSPAASTQRRTRDPHLLRDFPEPNQVIAPDGATDGLITGYYEPLLHGPQKGGAYQTPLYKVPDDMVTIDLASVYPELKGMRLRGKVVGR
jgi:membrane-bound lytic murein transglycosylase A